MTVKTNYVVAATTSAPYSTTATSPTLPVTGNVGDVLRQLKEMEAVCV